MVQRHRHRAKQGHEDLLARAATCSIPGVYEVPFGTTLREIIYNMAGGIKGGKKLKAVLMGGPSGVVVGPDALDRKLCAEDLAPGAGALIVLDEDKCIVDLMQNMRAVLLSRVLRAVRAVPRGHQAHARNVQLVDGGRGQRGRPQAA